MSTAFTLAHLSDVHLAPLPPFGVRDWRVKRLLGYANWQRNRRSVHLRPIVDRLVADLLAQRPDHIAVTGDLVNIGLAEEHIRALAWLQSLGSPDRVTVVPGNHDIYVPMRGDPGAMRWSQYMMSNALGGAIAGGTAAPFPFVRQFGRIVLIGVNSALPTPPFIARGRVGESQMQRLAVVLERVRSQGLMRIVLIHHPPLPGQAPGSKALSDAAALERLLEAHGAELVLHGHNHTNTVELRRWAGGIIPIVGITSASLGKPHKGESLGRYNLYRISEAGDGWRIEMLSRGLADPHGAIVELDRRFIDAAAPAPG
jgi:3',5'-cyclic AMP phosphodiesterase CpdA